MYDVPGGVHTLAEASTGDRLAIRSVLFRDPRAAYESVPVGEGEPVRCRASTPTHLLLETRDGRTVSVSRDSAHFIQIEYLGRSTD